MNFVFFSTILWDWGNGVHQSPQLALELARRGHSVLFVQPRSSSLAGTENLPIRVITLADLNLPMQMTERAWHGLKVERMDLVAEKLVEMLSQFEHPAEPATAIWFAPFDPFARLLPVLDACGYQLVYYPQDDYQGMIPLGYFRVSGRAEDYLATRAEVIFTLSEPVAEKMGRYGKAAHVIRDGVNLDEFRTAGNGKRMPTEVLRGEKTLGFWGFLSEAMVDPEFIEYTAREHPGWAINLIGISDNEGARVFPIRRLEQYNNVRFHGEVHHSLLPLYGRLFDACLLPAPDNDFSRGRDPLKIYEYLALYKPVVCSHMYQLASVPYVHIASTPAEFCAEIEAALSTPVDPRTVDEYLVKQTWSARADEFLAVLRECRAAGPAKVTILHTKEEAGRLVAPTFLDANPGLDLYLDVVDKNLAETQAWAGELETIVKEQELELKRIYSLPPIRLARWARSRMRLLKAPKR